MWEVGGNIAQRRGRTFEHPSVCASLSTQLFRLLRDNIFLSPTGESTVALNREAVATVAATEATNTGAQATKGALLAALAV